MTINRAKELLSIIEAFTKNKVIQYCDNNKNIWIDTDEPRWGDYVKYRIKPEPKYIPFTFEDMKSVRDKWIYFNNDTKRLIKINTYSTQGIVFSINTNNSYYNYDDLLKFFSFEDGTPCGNLVE